MPREVDLDLNKLMAAQDVTKVQLARRLDVSTATLTSYLENRWTVLDRTVLEGLADYFKCDIEALLRTRDTHFFDSYRSRSPPGPTCLFLCRPDLNVTQFGQPVGHRDNQAIAHVTNFLKNGVDRLDAFADTATTADQFAKHLQNNCVVLGSPWVNAASEMAICHAFNVEPFSGVSGGVPFAFRLARPFHQQAMRSSVCEVAPDGRRGIWIREEKELLEADQWSRDEFRMLRLTDARDCGIVLAKNYVSDGENRKLIVLSGFSGVGTEVAAEALVRNYRDIEPRVKDETVWGVIEVFYRKQAEEMTREIVKYNWRYRRGGRCPVAFARKKPLA